MRILFLGLAAGVALAACNARDPVADNANGAALPAPVTDTSPDAVPGPPGAETTRPSSTAQQAKVTIPPTLQGRWGLTPADCTSTRGDAKGLLIVSADELRFYESRAVPGNDVQVLPESASGTFSFTGEGQTWSKYEALKVSGDKLVRTESDPQASFTYAKC